MSVQTVLNLATVLMVLFGVFFMLVAAMGLLRMPDLYHRMHASTKGVTLGIAGLAIAGALAFASHPEANPVDIITKTVLIIIFQFVANPVGAHLLSKAAHLDKCPKWDSTLEDQLEADDNNQP